MKFTVSSNIKSKILANGGLSFIGNLGVLAVLIFLILQIPFDRGLTPELQFITIVFAIVIITTALLTYYRLAKLASLATLHTSINLHTEGRNLCYKKHVVANIQIEDKTFSYSARWTERYYLVTVTLETGEQIKLALDSKATFHLKEQVDKKTDTKVTLK